MMIGLNPAGMSESSSDEVASSRPNSPLNANAEATPEHVWWCSSISQGYPLFRVNYSWSGGLPDYAEYYPSCFFLGEDLVGPSWSFEVEGLEMSDPADHSECFLSYYPVTAGFALSLTGAFEAAKAAIPELLWPYVSHQVQNNRERFQFATELERIHGAQHLHKLAEAGLVDAFYLKADSVDGSPPRDWEETR
jgi:hypothetical protein